MFLFMWKDLKRNSIILISEWQSFGVTVQDIFGARKTGYCYYKVQTSSKYLVIYECMQFGYAVLFLKKEQNFSFESTKAVKDDPEDLWSVHPKWISYNFKCIFF